MDGQPINYWLLRMAGGEDRDQIRQRLVSIGPQAIPPLLAALNDRPFPPVDRLKIKVTELFGGRYPALARWLWQRPPSQRSMAAYTLAAMPPDPRIRDALLHALAQASNKDEDSNIGFHAIDGLKCYTNDAAIVVPALRRALKVPHNNIQAEAARALPGFGSRATPAIPELISLTTLPDSYLAAHAAAALGRFGPIASNALPALTQLLTNQEASARRCAAIAKWEIAPETGFPDQVLLWNMKHASLQERCFAAKALWKLDRNRRNEAVQALLAVISSSPDSRLNGQPFHGPRWIAAETLGEMGADAETALPVLPAVAQDDSDEWMRSKAREACERIERAVAETRRSQENSKNGHS